jgi:hypothetical protein
MGPAVPTAGAIALPDALSLADSSAGDDSLAEASAEEAGFGGVMAAGRGCSGGSGILGIGRCEPMRIRGGWLAGRGLSSVGSAAVPGIDSATFDDSTTGSVGSVAVAGCCGEAASAKWGFSEGVASCEGDEETLAEESLLVMERSEIREIR